jgi:hypothetical protein
VTGSRRRNAVLDALELLRRHGPSINLSQVRAFLYVCENEGLSVSELAELLSTTRATGSRVARSMGCESAPDSLSPYLGLVCLAGSDNGDPLKAIRLTDVGRRLQARIDDIISRAEPIKRDPREASRVSTLV